MTVNHATNLPRPAGRGQAPDRRPTIRVLLALAPPDGTTRYVDQITAEVPPELTIGYRTWTSAFRRRYDVLHLHWPENLLLADNLPVAAWRGMSLLILLARCAISRTAIVRTVHNVGAHEDLRWGWQNSLLLWVDRRTTLFIRINPCTEIATSAPVVTILHGHYRDRFRALPRRAARPRQLLYFGLIRPYKGIDALLSTFAHSTDAALRLRFVGKPLDSELAGTIKHAVESDSRVSVRFGFVPDMDLVDEVSGAQMVVLPYREMHNSGAVLVALSLDRPVIVPRTPVNEALDREVGPGWLHLYEGELTWQVIEAALAAGSAAADRQPPDLCGRDWSAIGEQHYQAYRSAIAAVRPRADET
ncbi:glycosyltransferase [Nakamurella sp. GG22]